MESEERKWSVVAGEFSFLEYEGVITTSRLAEAKRHIEYLKAKDPEGKLWQIEFFVNHKHPSAGFTPKPIEECIEKDAAYLQELESALREAFPDRSFTIIYRWESDESLVTFWQTDDDAPAKTSVGSRTPAGAAWCKMCEAVRDYADTTYHSHLEPPGVEWGRCTECGALVVVRQWQQVIFVERA